MLDMTEYTAEAWGQSCSLRADWSQAASPIEVRWSDGDGWHSTPHQVADFRHSWRTAMRQHLREDARMSGMDPDEEDVADEIDAAIEAAADS